MTNLIKQRPVKAASKHRRRRRRRLFLQWWQQPATISCRKSHRQPSSTTGMQVLVGRNGPPKFPVLELVEWALKFTNADVNMASEIATVRRPGTRFVPNKCALWGRTAKIRQQVEPSRNSKNCTSRRRTRLWPTRHAIANVPSSIDNLSTVFSTNGHPTTPARASANFSAWPNRPISITNLPTKSKMAQLVTRTRNHPFVSRASVTRLDVMELLVQG